MIPGMEPQDIDETDHAWMRHALALAARAEGDGEVPVGAVLVREGQVLARLDGDRLRLDLAQTEANLRKLERDYKRQLELSEKGLVAKGTAENAKFDLDALRGVPVPKSYQLPSHSMPALTAMPRSTGVLTSTAP